MQVGEDGSYICVCEGGGGEHAGGWVGCYTMQVFVETGRGTCASWLEAEKINMQCIRASGYNASFDISSITFPLS